MANQITAITAVSTQVAAPVTPVKLTLEQERPSRDLKQQLLQETPSDPHVAKMFETALNKLNGYLQKTSTELKFRVDKDTGKTVFKLISGKGETIIQVPSEELLAFARKLKEFEDSNTRGIIIDREG